MCQAVSSLLLEELEGESDVKAVDITEQADGTSMIVAGYENGTTKVWDAGYHKRQLNAQSPARL